MTLRNIPVGTRRWTKFSVVTAQSPVFDGDAALDTNAKLDALNQIFGANLKMLI